MKSEHRHELQTNDLGKVADKLVPLWQTYSNQITMVVCVVMVVAAGVIYWVRRSRDLESAAWNDLASARNAEDFSDVAERRSDSSAAQWARLQEGDARLTAATQLMFTDREAAVSELKKAREALEKLIGQRGILPEVRERALYGLARTLEAGSNGDETEALKAYETLVQDFPNTVYKQFAEKSINRLKSGGAQEFYAWFSKQNPKPPVRPQGPHDTGLKDDTDFDADLLKKHSKKEEKKVEEDEPAPKDAAGTDSPSKAEGDQAAPAKKEEEEATEAEKPKSEKPETDKAASEKTDAEKADTTKPKADKPEADQPEAEQPADKKPAASPDSKAPPADGDKPKADSESPAPKSE